MCSSGGEMVRPYFTKASGSLDIGQAWRADRWLGVIRHFRHARALPILALLAAGASQALAYPVTYSVSGTFGAATGPDPLKLTGKSFSISGSIDSLAACCP